MDLYTFVSLSQDFSRMGWAVQDQLDEIVNGEDLSEKNPNALRMIERFLRVAASEGVDDAEELADRIKAHLAAPAEK